MSLRRNEAAAVEMTALAAGAGPPAKRIATRRILVPPAAEDPEAGWGEGDMRNSIKDLSCEEHSRWNVPRLGSPAPVDMTVPSGGRTTPVLAQVHSRKIDQASD